MSRLRLLCDRRCIPTNIGWPPLGQEAAVEVLAAEQRFGDFRLLKTLKEDPIPMEPPLPLSNEQVRNCEDTRYRYEKTARLTQFSSFRFSGDDVAAEPTAIGANC